VVAADLTTPGNGGEVCTWTTGPLTCTLSGLTNGDSYTFTVEATNAVGTGAASSFSNAVTPATVPGAPSGASATPGNATATVTWTAPASDGGSPVTAYTVVAADSTTPFNGGETCTWTTGPLTCTLSGLTNGDSYTFTVTATNVVGSGAASSPSNAVTPATVPGAPSILTVTPGNGTITITWAAPSSDGGSPVTAYTVVAGDVTTPFNGGEVCTWTTGPLTCTLTGLTNGDTYIVGLSATNEAGVSATVISGFVTPI
jgi:predicted RNA-binding protein with TRAM domain